jgi:hypothetical protein
VTDRDQVRELPSGTTVEVTDLQGVKHVVQRPFRFQQGLRPDLVAPLDARPDLCARLYGLGLWGVDADELDAAIDELLQKPAA